MVLQALFPTDVDWRRLGDYRQRGIDWRRLTSTSVIEGRRRASASVEVSRSFFKAEPEFSQTAHSKLAKEGILGQDDKIDKIALRSEGAVSP